MKEGGACSKQRCVWKV